MSTNHNFEHNELCEFQWWNVESLQNILQKIIKFTKLNNIMNKAALNNRYVYGFTYDL